MGATGTGHVSEARALGLPVAPAARSTGSDTCSLAVGPEQPLLSKPSAVGPLDREGAAPLSTAWQRVRLLATDQPPVCGGALPHLSSSSGLLRTGGGAVGRDPSTQPGTPSTGSSGSLRGGSRQPGGEDPELCPGHESREETRVRIHTTLGPPVTCPPLGRREPAAPAREATALHSRSPRPQPPPLRPRPLRVAAHSPPSVPVPHAAPAPRSLHVRFLPCRGTQGRPGPPTVTEHYGTKGASGGERRGLLETCLR